jgi:hypothetical protein
MYVLEKGGPREMEVPEIIGKCLAKQMGAIPEPLREDRPGELLGVVCVWVCPGKSKNVL